MTFKTIESKRKGKKKVNHIYLRPTGVSFLSLKFEWLPYNWVVNSELHNRKFEKWYSVICAERIAIASVLINPYNVGFKHVV